MALFNAVSQLLSLTSAVIIAYLLIQRKLAPRKPESSRQGELSPKELLPEKKIVSSSRPPLDVLYLNPSDGIPGETEVDIIAVHGLGSNVDWSWTWQDESRRATPVNWLKDLRMLPAVVPKSRIMVYNYDSKWHANAAQVRLQLCGEELVHSVHNFRSGMHDRPVIFIGHSLGGLVILYAMLYAQHSEKFRYLPSQTVGFIALGTPFKGTNMHYVAHILAKLMALAGSHQGIINELVRDNPSLSDKLQEFCQLRDTISIPTCSFFELYKTDYGKKVRLPGLIRVMVVKEESACIPGWDRFPLQTDHLKLNKFDGPNNRSFLSVSEQIRNMCDNATNVIRNRNTAMPERHFVVPFGRNEGFVGRESILTQLLETIPPSANADNCQRIAIEGLGGVGKTQIALETAFRVRDKYPDCSIFWVPAVDLATFENAYREIGRRLGVVGIDDVKADVKALVKGTLSRQDSLSWLLIIDNADDVNLLFGGDKNNSLCNYLPFNLSGSILFTTRNHEAAVRLEITGKNLISTPEMTRAESMEMLQGNLKENQMLDMASTMKLLDFLADLPLAIKQSSAYMAKTGMTTTTYLHHCLSSDKTLIKLLSKDFEQRDRYEGTRNPIATTWFISFEHISRDNPLAARYLRHISFLAEKDIPKLLLPVADDELDADEAIGTLKAYAFISQREEQDSFDVHRLVRLTMRNWLDKEDDRQECITEVVQRLSEAFPLPDHDNKDIWMKYLPHAQAALEFREDARDEQAKSDLLFKVGQCHYVLGKYQDAEQIYRQTLDLRMKLLGKENPDTLKSMSCIGLVLYHQGKFNEAEQMQRQAIDLKEKALGKEHPDTLESNDYLGLVLRNQGKYEESENILQHTLEVKTRVLGPEHPSTLNSMTFLGLVLYRQDKFDEAERMLRQAMELRQKVLGKEHFDTIETMDYLGLVLSCHSKHEESEQLHRQALEVKARVLGNEHPSTLDCMTFLARVLFGRGKFDEAGQIHQQAIELRGKVLGKEHPDTLDEMDYLGLVFRNQEKYEEAEHLHRQTLGIKLRLQGKDNPSTIYSKTCLSDLLKLQGKQEDA